MANAGVTIRVKSNKLGAIRAQLPEAVDQVVEKFIIDVDAYATAQTPRDTGFLANSKELYPNRIYWPAHYAAYVNFGTRYMAAQPFASNAVDRAMPGFEAAARELEAMLA